MSKCKNSSDPDWICLCDHLLDGTWINSWLSDGNRLRRLRDGEDREKLIAELEEEANGAYCMWRMTL